MLQDAHYEGCSVCVGSVGDTAIVEVTGEVDMASASLLVRALGDAVQSGSGSLILDVQRLTYIDSAGLQALISTLQSMEELGREMVIAGCHGIFRKLMEIGRFDTRFQMFATVEEAIDALREKVLPG